ncbi:Synembryn-A [Golovinomyces cichoracearum]|uniref:Synembryn-A n=1 Tax=Golovinomyces cichoracearum TaxID=62708 RepID=A0A420I9U0_9PEZI|nr:Synembryn-A [Golovinomyces cichoracearum]
MSLSESIAASLSGSAKLNEVTKLVKYLAEDLKDNNLSQTQREKFLETLKIYGRDPRDSDPIFTEEGIKTLAGHAFNNFSPNVFKSASGCLANAMLLEAGTRQIFVGLGLATKACNFLNNENREYEFLMSRILFLTTYETDIDLEKLIETSKLAECVCVNINRHANRVAKQKEPIKLELFERMALIETLKLIFNLTYFCPQKSSAFSLALKDLLTLLAKLPVLEERPLDPPIGSLVNAIINMDLATNVSTFFPPLTPDLNIDICVDILNKSIRFYNDEDLEQNVTPLIVLLRKANDLAPKETKSHLQKLLLPSLRDRQKILGRVESLPSRLLCQMSNPLAPKLRDSISALLFELSGKDPKRFIHNFGFGFTSGFLHNNSLSIPDMSLNISGENEDELSDKINPITGQLLDNEDQIEMEVMTEEEKEREAEKLFVLFDRLEKSGVISVQNPMRSYQESGRFEELKSETSSDK